MAKALYELSKRRSPIIQGPIFLASLAIFIIVENISLFFTFLFGDLNEMDGLYF